MEFYDHTDTNFDQYDELQDIGSISPRLSVFKEDYSFNGIGRKNIGILMNNESPRQLWAANAIQQASDSTQNLPHQPKNKIDEIQRDIETMLEEQTKTHSLQDKQVHEEQKNDNINQFLNEDDDYFRFHVSDDTFLPLGDFPHVDIQSEQEKPKRADEKLNAQKSVDQPNKNPEQENDIVVDPMKEKILQRYKADEQVLCFNIYRVPKVKINNPLSIIELRKHYEEINQRSLAKYNQALKNAEAKNESLHGKVFNNVTGKFELNTVRDQAMERKRINLHKQLQIGSVFGKMDAEIDLMLFESRQKPKMAVQPTTHNLICRASINKAKDQFLEFGKHIAKSEKSYSPNKLYPKKPLKSISARTEALSIPDNRKELDQDQIECKRFIEQQKQVKRKLLEPALFYIQDNGIDCEIVDKKKKAPLRDGRNKDDEIVEINSQESLEKKKTSQDLIPQKRVFARSNRIEEDDFFVQRENKTLEGQKKQQVIQEEILKDKSVTDKIQEINNIETNPFTSKPSDVIIDKRSSEKKSKQKIQEQSLKKREEKKISKMSKPSSAINSDQYLPSQKESFKISIPTVIPQTQQKSQTKSQVQKEQSVKQVTTPNSNSMASSIRTRSKASTTKEPLYSISYNIPETKSKKQDPNEKIQTKVINKTLQIELKEHVINKKPSTLKKAYFEPDVEFEIILDEDNDDVNKSNVPQILEQSQQKKNSNSGKSPCKKNKAIKQPLQKEETHQEEELFYNNHYEDQKEEEMAMICEDINKVKVEQQNENKESKPLEALDDSLILIEDPIAIKQLEQTFKTLNSQVANLDKGECSTTQQNNIQHSQESPIQQLANPSKGIFTLENCSTDSHINIEQELQQELDRLEELKQSKKQKDINSQQVKETIFNFSSPSKSSIKSIRSPQISPQRSNQRSNYLFALKQCENQNSVVNQSLRVSRQGQKNVLPLQSLLPQINHQNFMPLTNVETIDLEQQDCTRITACAFIQQITNQKLNPKQEEQRKFIKSRIQKQYHKILIDFPNHKSDIHKDAKFIDFYINCLVLRKRPFGNKCESIEIFRVGEHSVQLFANFDQGICSLVKTDIQQFNQRCLSKEIEQAQKDAEFSQRFNEKQSAFYAQEEQKRYERKMLRIHGKQYLLNSSLNSSPASQNQRQPDQRMDNNYELVSDDKQAPILKPKLLGS